MTPLVADDHHDHIPDDFMDPAKFTKDLVSYLKSKYYPQPWSQDEIVEINGMV